MSETRNRTALITGATSGIGYALSRVFAREGYDLVLVGRSEERLLQVAEKHRTTMRVRVKTIRGDLSEPSTPERIHEAVMSEGIVIDVLVNNAGFGTYGGFVGTSLEEELAQLQTNIASLTALTKHFAVDMKKRGSGTILNVSSLSGLVPGPLMSVYYATKAYSISFSYALAEEFRGSGVTVTVLLAPVTRTEFHARAHMNDTRLPEFFPMRADHVAEAAYRGMTRNQTVVIPGWKNRVIVMLIRFAPRRLAAVVVRWLHGQRKQRPRRS